MMMRGKSLCWIAVSILALGIIAVAVVGFTVVRRGFSAREEPSAVEEVLARQMRRLAVPSRARLLPNRVVVSSKVLLDARAHFADHCATCHANDGSGDTTIGKNLYPKAPDMRRSPTQRLTDGELYYIIQNGVRLTGMPAWGKAGDENDEESWKLVHFIRRLADLTPAQLEEMKALNPKTPDEMQEQHGSGQHEPDTSEGKRQVPRHRH